MPFSQSIKKDVRKRAWYACCFCKRISFALEIHHIVPAAEGGSDSEDNASPLCANCHRTYGGNPDWRSRIRETRDDWYEKCHELFAPTSDPAEVFRSIHDLFTVEEIESLTVHNPCYVLGQGDERGDNYRGRFSFQQEEYVHPLIVKELLGWISDRHETVVGIDLESANKSNRFFGDVQHHEHDNKAWIACRSENESFSYAFVATTPSGINILECHDWGGGSGVFGSVALLCMETDRAMDMDDDGRPTTRQRSVLKILGQHCLGDRYSGRIWYESGVLHVGPDRGWFSRGDDAAWQLPVL